MVSNFLTVAQQNNNKGKLKSEVIKEILKNLGHSNAINKTKNMERVKSSE